jgi:hypothetical protein
MTKQRIALELTRWLLQTIVTVIAPWLVMVVIVILSSFFKIETFPQEDTIAVGLLFLATLPCYLLSLLIHLGFDYFHVFSETLRNSTRSKIAMGWFLLSLVFILVSVSAKSISFTLFLGWPIGSLITYWLSEVIYRFFSTKRKIHPTLN